MAGKFCIECGQRLGEQEAFCSKCGTPTGVSAQPNRGAPPPPPPRQQNYAPPQQSYAPPQQSYAPPQQSYAPPPQSYEPNPYAQQHGASSAGKKSKKGLLIAGIAIGAVALAAIAIALVVKGLKAKPQGPGNAPASVSLENLPEVSYSYLARQKSVEVSFSAADHIYPNLYSTMDSVVNLTATSEGGDTDALIRVEIVGFTQPFEQKVTLSEQITKLYIKPPLLTGYIDLASAKDAQVSITVSDNDTGKIYVRETRKLRLMSVYDFMLWDDEFGGYSDSDLLAWLTPEAEGILSLRRNAIDWLSYYTDGEFSSLPGYQLAAFGEDEYWLNSVWQVVAIQAAMSQMGMRYNMGSFSMSEGYNQRVLRPEDALYSGSGVCIETALIMASAIQSANMHAMLVLPPGHAQVAIEDWNQSGDYWLIETTVLPFGERNNASDVVSYLTQEEWLAYLADPWGNGSGPCVVLDCDMAGPLGIHGFSN